MNTSIVSGSPGLHIRKQMGKMKETFDNFVLERQSSEQLSWKTALNPIHIEFQTISQVHLRHDVIPEAIQTGCQIYRLQESAM